MKTKTMIIIAAFFMLSGCSGFQIHVRATYDSSPATQTNPLATGMFTTTPAAK